MKRLSTILVFGLLLSLFLSSFGFAQTQDGNASYNPSKTGFTISHASLSFNTLVRVTNLSNNLWVEAKVDSRIAISPDRIADISREAGDAIGMARTGMTLVRIEKVSVNQPAADPVPERETPAAAPQPVTPPRSAAPAAVPKEPVVPVEEPEPVVTTITELQYVPVPAPYPAQPCCNIFLMLALLFLLLVIIVLLVLIVIRFSRPLPIWPWRYPLWFRRYLRYVKKRKRRR